MDHKKVEEPVRSPFTECISPEVCTSQDLFFFDWDDTLFPTTWMSDNQYIKKMPGELPVEIQTLFAHLDLLLKNLFSMVFPLGKVYILTLADEGWINHGFRHFYPSLACFYRRFSLLARPPSIRTTDKAQTWKKNKMSQLVLSEYGDVGHRPGVHSVYCFGDSLNDRDAAKQLEQFRLGLNIKAVKFSDTPSIKTLYQEISLVKEGIDRKSLLVPKPLDFFIRIEDQLPPGSYSPRDPSPKATLSKEKIRSSRSKQKV